MTKNLRIVFMGTPEFAIPSLDILIKKNYNIKGVVTALDKPAGRGRGITISPVKEYALKNNLRILQPEKLRDPDFLSELKSLDANLFIIVAFRMLPDIVWKMPEYGSFNLHASLLPQYRGAAPINRAIMEGETETGITTFFLADAIDTGRILFQERIGIGADENAGQLHDRLKIAGADLVLKTVRAIETSDPTGIDQKEIEKDLTALKAAPKIFHDDCHIDWTKPGVRIFNQIRGLSPYPAAATKLISPAGDEYQLKIYRSSFNPGNQEPAYPAVVTDGKNFLGIRVGDGVIDIAELQLAGKKKMDIQAFLRGFHVDNSWKIR